MMMRMTVATADDKLKCIEKKATSTNYKDILRYIHKFLELLQIKKKRKNKIKQSKTSSFTI